MAENVTRIIERINKCSILIFTLHLPDWSESIQSIQQKAARHLGPFHTKSPFCIPNHRWLVQQVLAPLRCKVFCLQKVSRKRCLRIFRRAALGKFTLWRGYPVATITA
jgi:hypothetical protein